MAEKRKAGRLAARLDEAKLSAGTLASVTDELNAKLGTAEAVLRGLQLGVTATVEIDQHRDLTFAKVGKEWGLFVETSEPGEDFPIFKYTRLSSASRELRLNAVDRLPDLIDLLITTTAQEVGKVRERIQKVDGILDEFGDFGTLATAEPTTDATEDFGDPSNDGIPF